MGIAEYHLQFLPSIEQIEAELVTNGTNDLGAEVRDKLGG